MGANLIKSGNEWEKVLKEVFSRAAQEAGWDPLDFMVYGRSGHFFVGLMKSKLCGVMKELPIMTSDDWKWIVVGSLPRSTIRIADPDLIAKFSEVIRRNISLNLGEVKSGDVS